MEDAAFVRKQLQLVGPDFNNISGNDLLHFWCALPRISLNTKVRSFELPGKVSETIKSEDWTSKIVNLFKTPKFKRHETLI